METLVVYYSLEGNTKLIADTISEKISCDVLELKPKKDIPKKGFLKYFWGGKQVVFNHKAELQPFNKDFDKYDLIIMGSPVWAGTYAPPFNTFFQAADIKNKKIALFCCYAGSEGKTFSAFKSQLVGNEVIGEMGFKDPLTNNKEKTIDNVKQWLNRLKL